MSDELIARIKDAMPGVIDPELGYNVAGLRLGYSITVDKARPVRHDRDRKLPSEGPAASAA